VSTAEAKIADVFTAAGARGFLHAREIGRASEVAVGADDPVVLASVFKIPVAVAYAREAAAGRLDETGRTRVGKRYRVGGIGTAGCADDVELSWRDLALFMLTMILLYGQRFAEGYALANDEEQAQSRVFQAIRRIVECSPSAATR